MDASILNTPRERQICFELLEGLHSSLDLHDVARRAYTTLSKLVPADQGAFCVSLPDRVDAYEWAVAELPIELVSSYAELLPHDFVRRSVLSRPGEVLRDSEMLGQRELGRTVLYHRCRELGLQIGQVMAVQLAVGPDSHGGMTLYRNRRRPFSERDRALVQQLAPFVATALRNCRQFSEAALRSSALEAALRRKGVEVVVVKPPRTELTRSEGATALIERWFSVSERAGGGLPAPLVEALAGATLAGSSWVRWGAKSKLRVSISPLAVRGAVVWVLDLREVGPPTLPDAWRARLTRQQSAVATRVLRGWTDEVIADDLRRAKDTVKKHLQEVYNRLGIPNRAALLAAARDES
ncbi:LuxR C-terminal-related transcriptional regulator [Sorangium sp. So ce1036]|uniref:LuxR C-terminal-related transcriptional regulator n=1 Tax=Sorangium sp. So ce1036 TaxID=3133328 RepID=UPI003EFCFED3